MAQPRFRLTSLDGPIVSLTRMVAGFLFLLRGGQGLFGWLGGVDGQGGVALFPVWPDWWGSALEFGGGSLVLVGLFTRVAAVVCSGVMAYAYFTVHAPMGLFPALNLGEPAVLFCWLFLLIAVVGPGPFAVSRLARPA